MRGVGMGTAFRHSPIDTDLMMGEKIEKEERLFQAHAGR
jgi:hypothetical protein